jgi:hypothetical protein
MTSDLIFTTADARISDRDLRRPELAARPLGVRWIVAAFVVLERILAVGALLVVALFASDAARMAMREGMGWLAVTLAAVLGAALGLLLCGAVSVLMGWLYRSVRSVAMHMAARRILSTIRRAAGAALANDKSAWVRWNDPWPGAAVVSLQSRTLLLASAQTGFKVFRVPLGCVIGVCIRNRREITTTTRSSPIMWLRPIAGFAWSPGFRTRTHAVTTERATLELQYEHTIGTVPQTVDVPFGADVRGASSWLTLIRNR